MQTQKQKFYCYVDETGQDTKGRFFLVSIILTDQIKKEGLEQTLEKIEQKTGKKKKKWTRMEFAERKTYVKEIASIKELKSSIYYSIYHDTKTYTQLTAFSVAKAVFDKENNTDYAVTVIIDGLTKKDTEKIRSELKKLKVKYDNIRGMKDEQNAFIRLADCIAGLLRDYTENQTYAKKLIDLLKEKECILEV